MNDSTRQPPYPRRVNEPAQDQGYDDDYELEFELEYEQLPQTAKSLEQNDTRSRLVRGQKASSDNAPETLIRLVPNRKSTVRSTLHHSPVHGDSGSSFGEVEPEFRLQRNEAALARDQADETPQAPSSEPVVEPLKVSDDNAPVNDVATEALDNIESEAASSITRRLIRFGLLVCIPLIVLLTAVWFYIHGGRYVTTENAYVKANIIAVSADVAGRVQQVLVKDNQYVEAGTTLFTLDTTPYDIDIAQAEADMAVVRTDIEALRADYREALVSIEEAREQQKHLNKELKRQQTMQSRGIGTAKDLDQARHEATMAKRRLNTQQARARQALASLNGKEAIKAEDHPRFLRAMAARAHADNIRAKTLVKAPSSGVISNMKLQSGEYVEDGKAIFSLIESDSLWVEANLKETQLTHLIEGQSATFVADAYPNVTWQANIDTIAPATGAEFSLLPPQNATGNWVKVVQRVPVRLTIGLPQSKGIENTENPRNPPVLRAGMTVSISVDTERKNELPTWAQRGLDALPLPMAVRDWLSLSMPQ